MIVFKTVAAKLVFSVLGLMACFLILLGFQYQSRSHEITARYESDLSALIEFLKRPSEDLLFTGNSKSLDEISEKIVGKGIVGALTISDQKGIEVYRAPMKLPTESKVREISLTQTLDEGDLAIVPELTSDQVKTKALGVMTIYLDHTEMDAATRDLRIQLLILVSITLLSGVLTVALAIKIISNPLKKIQQAMQLIQRGHYDATLNINQRDEIGQLAQLVNDVSLDLCRKRQQHKEQMKEITNAHTEYTNSQIEKNTVLDRLLEGVIPALSEAMDSVRMIKDQEGLKLNLSRSVFFALGLTQETKDLVSSYSDQVVFSPERMSFLDMVDRVRDTLTHLAEHKGIIVEPRIDAKPELRNHFVIVDNVRITRLFSHIYEMIDLKTSTSVKVDSIWIILDGVESDKINATVLLQVGGSDLSTDFIQSVNHFLATDISDDSISRFRADYERFANDFNASNFAVQLYTVIGLKKIIDSLRGNYTIINLGSQRTLHTFTCAIPASQSEDAINERLHQFTRNLNQQVCIIGSAQFIRAQRSRLFGADESISYIHYDKVTKQDLSTQVHYIIDLMSDRMVGQAIAKEIIELRSTTHNVCAALASSDYRNNTGYTELGFDYGFDFSLCETVSIGDIQRIRSRKKLTERNDALKEIFKKIQEDEL